METIAIHESKKSDKVVKFVAENELSEHCSKKYADRILSAKENGQLWGCYLTSSGKLRATFI